MADGDTNIFHGFDCHHFRFDESNLFVLFNNLMNPDDDEDYSNGEMTVYENYEVNAKNGNSTGCNGPESDFEVYTDLTDHEKIKQCAIDVFKTCIGWTCREMHISWDSTKKQINVELGGGMTVF